MSIRSANGHDSTANASSVKKAKLTDVSGVMRDRYTTASRSFHHRLRLPAVAIDSPADRQIPRDHSLFPDCLPVSRGH